LFTENLVCVTSRGSPLAGRSVSLEELSQYPQIITSSSRPNFRGSIDSWFEQFGLERNVVISAPCFSIVPLFLETTDTIAFLPSRALVNSNLAIIHLDENPLSFDVIYAWHPRSNNDALHNWVADLLRGEWHDTYARLCVDSAAVMGPLSSCCQCFAIIRWSIARAFIDHKELDEAKHLQTRGIGTSSVDLLHSEFPAHTVNAYITQSHTNANAVCANFQEPGLGCRPICAAHQPGLKDCRPLLFTDRLEITWRSLENGEVVCRLNRPADMGYFKRLKTRVSTDEYERGIIW